jgi:fluoroquinolone transport system permease protein
MNKFFALFLGEIQRLWRYKITFFGLLVSGIWLIIILLVSEQEAIVLLPQLLILDSGLMSIILLAAAYFYEKQEGTMKAILVSPIPAPILLAAKLAGALVGGLSTLVLLWLAMLVIHQSTFPFFPALGLILLVSLAHLCIGYVLIYLSHDFMDLLLKYTGVVLVLFVPTILVSLNIIPNGWQWLASLSPTFAGQQSLSHLWQPLTTLDLVLNLVILAAFPTLLLPLYVLPQFRKEAIRS